MDQSNFVFPTWANWLAQDANGAIWVYEVEPLQQHQGWYENEVGRSKKIAHQTNNKAWTKSLTKISTI